MIARARPTAPLQLVSTGTLHQLAHDLDDIAAACLSPGGVLAPLMARLEAIIARHPDEVEGYWHLATLLHEQGLAPEALHQALANTWRRCDGGPSSRQFIEQFQAPDPYGLNEIPAVQREAGCLLVQFSDDLRYSDLIGVHREQAKFLGRVRNPQLTCSPRDMDAIPAHRRTIIEDWLKRSKSHRVVRHRGVMVICHPEVFGPAIDTLLFHQVLRDYLEAEPTRDQFTTVMEVGVGSGFLLSGAITALAPSLTTVIANDIHEAARLTASANIYRTVRRHYPDQIPAPDVRFLIRPDGLAATETGSVSILMLNPPYVTEEPEGTRANAYSGTGLIEETLCGHGPRVLASNGLMVVLTSSLCEEEVRHFLARSPLELVAAPVTRTVPLDLAEIARDPAWMMRLRSREGLITAFDSAQYPYWHRLSVMLLRHRG